MSSAINPATFELIKFNDERAKQLAKYAAEDGDDETEYKRRVRLYDFFHRYELESIVKRLHPK